MWEGPQGQVLGLSQDLAQLLAGDGADRKELAPGTTCLSDGGKGALHPNSAFLQTGGGLVCRWGLTE